MITWLSSYPRSGNTMLRIFFKEVFGLLTQSKYPELSRSPLGKFVGSAGSRLISGGWSEAKPRLVASAEQHFIKTHEHPEDDQCAIVIVRDPRATIVSYWHYLNELGGQSISLEAVANGLCAYGEWTAFYDAWQPQNRANTLLLRYEELLADPTKCIEKISGFTGLKPSGQWNGEISRFQAIDPQFFRVGNNQANISELSPQLEEFILSRCEPMMTKLGYKTPLSLPT